MSLSNTVSFFLFTIFNTPVSSLNSSKHFLANSKEEFSSTLEFINLANSNITLTASAVLTSSSIASMNFCLKSSNSLTSSTSFSVNGDSTKLLSVNSNFSLVLYSLSRPALA